MLISILFKKLFLCAQRKLLIKQIRDMQINETYNCGKYSCYTQSVNLQLSAAHADRKAHTTLGLKTPINE